MLYFHKKKLTGHFLSISVLLFFFTGILILEGLVFQLSYGYFHIDWSAYSGTVLFNTFPLILFSGFFLLINDQIKNRFVALGISVVLLMIMATPITKKIISYPLLRIFSDFKGTYSDFNGYGIYSIAFAERLLFGSGIIFLLWMMNESFKTKKRNLKKALFTVLLLIIG